MQGYIKDHRKEVGSDIWMMPPLYHRTWQWLKYNVNHEEAIIPMRDGSQFPIKRGQKLTSIRDVAKGISWWEGTKEKIPNPKTISTILEWMEKTGMIIIDRGQGNRQYTLITLINYEVYQGKSDQGNSKVTDSKQSADINNNDKNDLNDKKETNKPNTFSVYTSNTDLLSTLKSFEEFRKKIRKPMTDKAKELLIGSLNKLGSTDEEKIAILNQSILNGWQGVFELKRGVNLNAVNGGYTAGTQPKRDLGF